MGKKIEKFEVRNRWTGAVQFTAEIETTPDMTPRFKLGLADDVVERAYKHAVRLARGITGDHDPDDLEHVPTGQPDGPAGLGDPPSP